ncbi:polysaccharide biosynthesis protein [Gammaproteobacteria bacterium]|nr:polysaccharide biosynthesis protein [Gammaproteobacteria bacterium]
MFSDKTLLITGGTGSFGNALLKKLLKSDFKEIRIFSRDEKKQEDMRISLSNSKVKFYIGDIRDSKAILDVMNGVDYVFHAAALKQVPSCDFYPMEAVKTNILGAQNVLNAADSMNIKNAVFLSTDKAVYPINAMGMSKALMEKLVSAKSRNNNKPIFSCTRYGNVMASRGSVIPLFVSQIKSGGKITITDPEMTRFMMSLEESVDLVEFAFLNAKRGDIFVKKSPAVNLITLVEAIKNIFNSNNEIKYIGTRHGEKLYETLLTREEMEKAEDFGEYYRVPSDNRDLNYSQYFTEGEVKISELNDYNSHNTEQYDVKQMTEKLLTLDYIQKELAI